MARRHSATGDLYGGRIVAPHVTKVGRREGDSNFYLEKRLISIPDSENRETSGRINEYGKPVYGESQIIRFYRRGTVKSVMWVGDEGEYTPDTFIQLQRSHCKEARDKGYPYELYYYEAGEKRDSTKAFPKLVRRSQRDKKKGNGLLVPVKARRYR